MNPDKFRELLNIAEELAEATRRGGLASDDDVTVIRKAEYAVYRFESFKAALVWTAPKSGTGAT